MPANIRHPADQLAVVYRQQQDAGDPPIIAIDMRTLPFPVKPGARTLVCYTPAGVPAALLSFEPSQGQVRT